MTPPGTSETNAQPDLRTARCSEAVQVAADVPRYVGQTEGCQYASLPTLGADRRKIPSRSRDLLSILSTPS